MNISQNSAKYRHDIDGLRAVAVILVIFFHAGADWLSSGFIGVDIFFVISGYLITGIILTQVRERRFSLANFFVRRLWRIQPALIVVSLITLLAASVLYVVPDYMSFLKSAKYNSLFLSNQFFAKQSVTYASPESEFFPLLHTWSLSVEWQWYLFLPLIVLTAVSASKRVKSMRMLTGRNDVYLLAIWVITTLVLSVVSLKISNKHPGESYYFLTARAFEFTAGGAAFLFTRVINCVRSWLVTAISGLALASIILIATKKGVIDIYPNVWSVAVVFCTAAIIFSGNYKERAISGFLALQPMAFVGRLSYSLYLWHWPVFVFMRYQGIELTGYNLVIAISGITLLSLISYFCIEKPLRKKRLNLKWTFILLVLLPIALFTGFYSLSVKHEGFPQRLGADYAHRQSILDEYSAKAGNRAQCLAGSDDPNQCQLGDLSGSRTALVIGDSNSNHFWGFFDVLTKDAHIKASALSASSCLTLPGIWQYDWWIYRNVSYKECHDRTENYYRLIKQNHYDYVIIGEIWEQYAHGPYLINNEGGARSDALSKQRMNKAVRDALKIIIDSGARPVFISTIFPMPQGYQECISRQAANREKLTDSACSAPRLRTSEDDYIAALFTQLKEEYPSLIFIDPKDVQCPNGECISQLDSIPLYRDVGHLTDYASYRFGSIYLKSFGNPFNK